MFYYFPMQILEQWDCWSYSVADLQDLLYQSNYKVCSAAFDNQFLSLQDKTLPP